MDSNNFTLNRLTNVDPTSVTRDQLTGLTIGQKTVIQETWRRLNSDDRGHGLRIFLTFFKHYPQHKCHYVFMDANRDMGLSEVAVKEGIRQHSLRFMAALDSVVKVAVKRASTSWTYEIKKMARIYWALKHTAHDFKELSTTLVDYMEPYFPDGLQDYSRQSWTHMLGVLGDRLRERLRAKRYKKEKGFWWRLKLAITTQGHYTDVLACAYDTDQAGINQWSPKPGGSFMRPGYAHHTRRQDPENLDPHSNNSYTDSTARSSFIQRPSLDKDLTLKNEALSGDKSFVTNAQVARYHDDPFVVTMSKGILAEARHTLLNSLQRRRRRFTEQRRQYVDPQHSATNRRRSSTTSPSSPVEPSISGVIVSCPTTDHVSPEHGHSPLGPAGIADTRRSNLALRLDTFATTAQETSQEIHDQVEVIRSTAAPVTPSLIPAPSFAPSAGHALKIGDEMSNHAIAGHTRHCDVASSTYLTKSPSGDLEICSTRPESVALSKPDPSACKTPTRPLSPQMTEKSFDAQGGVCGNFGVIKGVTYEAERAEVKMMIGQVEATAEPETMLATNPGLTCLRPVNKEIEQVDSPRVRRRRMKEAREQELRKRFPILKDYGNGWPFLIGMEKISPMPIGGKGNEERAMWDEMVDGKERVANKETKELDVKETGAV